MVTFSFSSRADELIFQVTKFAEEHIDISGALLVGSYARGDARPDSDVDICFLSNNKEPFFESYE